MKHLDIEEHNAQVFAKNTQELSAIFDKGLQSDGGEHWISPDDITDALSEHGYLLIKLDPSTLDV